MATPLKEDKVVINSCNKIITECTKFINFARN